MTKKHKITDIKIGQKFNKLTILSYDQFKKGKHHWFCKCDCGSLMTWVIRPTKTKNREYSLDRINVTQMIIIKALQKQEFYE